MHISPVEMDMDFYGYDKRLKRQWQTTSDSSGREITHPCSTVKPDKTKETYGKAFKMRTSLPCVMVLHPSMSLFQKLWTVDFYVF